MTGCGGKIIEVNGVSIREEIWNDTAATFRSRAQFDFDCAADIELRLISRKGRHPDVVGVRGCGRRGTYVRTIRQEIDPIWGVYVNPADAWKFSRERRIT
jgi:hypothetical protein